MTSGTATDDAGVAARIREDIIAGDYAPGQRLVESELGERYDVSRATVRSALAELDHEGLVERIAHRGARVRTVSVDEAIAITEVRMVIEGLCARKAAEQISEAGIVDLRSIGASMKSAVSAGDLLAYRSMNVRLHDTIRQIANQPVADEMLARLVARNVRHQYRLALRPGRAQVSLVEHLAIIDDICSREPEAADRSMRRHVESVIGALRETGPLSS
jgi:DNA-binding GntR family transcriptional regulator